MEKLEIDDSVYKSLVTAGDVPRKEQQYKRVSVCLGLLCAVLLAGNVGQCVFPTQANYNTQMQNKNDVLSSEKNKVQRDYDAANKKQVEVRLTNLAKEEERLQQSYQPSTAKTDEMEASFKTMTKQRDQLQANYSSLKKERDQLKTSYKEVQSRLDELQMKNNNLTAVKNQLQTKHTNLQRGKEELQTLFTAHVLNEDQLKRNLSSLLREKDQLRQRFDSLTRSKSRIETDYNDLQRHKDNLQSRFNNLWTEKEQLQNKYSSLTTDRDQLQASLYKMADKVKDMLCSTNWTKFNLSCYFISTAKKNWAESRQACLDEGADLMISDSHEEQVFVNGLMAVNQNAWIGLTDHDEEGVWMWLDGTAVTTTYWQAGQPNSKYGEQDCAELLQSAAGGEWNDDGCFAEQNWICEK